MAICKNIRFQPVGFSAEMDVAGAYHRIIGFAGDKHYVEFTLGVFESGDASTPIMHKNYFFSPSMSKDNIVAQCYNHLKALPEFAGAVDC